jgi:hypothetical protein
MPPLSNCRLRLFPYSFLIRQWKLEQAQKLLTEISCHPADEDVAHATKIVFSCLVPVALRRRLGKSVFIRCLLFHLRLDHSGVRVSSLTEESGV